MLFHLHLAPRYFVLDLLGLGISVTSTRCLTLFTIPRIVGLSSCSTVRCRRFSPIASIVLRWSCGKPIALFLHVIAILPMLPSATPSRSLAFLRRRLGEPFPNRQLLFGVL